MSERRHTHYGPAQREKRKRDLVQALQDGRASGITELSRIFRMPRPTIYKWMKEDPIFARQVEAALAGLRPDEARPPVPDFPTFRRECFGHETYAHQLAWIEAIESHDLVLVLVPPEFAKTTTLSIEYPVWRICRDRDVRIISVSKSQVMSRKILQAVKKRLADHSWYAANGFRSVPGEWGPFVPGPGERTRTPWAADLFYVSGISSAEKDPTMEALGVGGQIYGARADLIILDDIATLRNQQSETEREKLLDWINQEVMSRLSHSGKLVIVGTRVHENDIYSTLLDPEKAPWAADFHTVVQPAILDEEERRSLWPEQWPWEKLMERRRRTKPRIWSLVYQQSSTGAPDAPFTEAALEKAKDPTYRVGQQVPGTTVVMGVDPALEGTCAVSVVALDHETGERWLVDCIWRTAVRNPEVLKSLLVETAYRYRPVRCRIERNAMQGFLSKDPDLRRRLAAAGCATEEEYTSPQNKYDPEWGVGSLAAQFDQGLWHIPWAGGSAERMRPLLEELASWRPGVKVRQDRVMSLWLAELSARSVGAYHRAQGHHTPQVPGWVRGRRVPRWVHGRYLAHSGTR